MLQEIVREELRFYLGMLINLQGNVRIVWSGLGGVLDCRISRCATPRAKILGKAVKIRL